MKQINEVPIVCNATNTNFQEYELPINKKLKRVQLRKQYTYKTGFIDSEFVECNIHKYKNGKSYIHARNEEPDILDSFSIFLRGYK